MFVGIGVCHKIKVEVRCASRLKRLRATDVEHYVEKHWCRTLCKKSVCSVTIHFKKFNLTTIWISENGIDFCDFEDDNDDNDGNEDDDELDDEEDIGEPEDGGSQLEERSFDDVIGRISDDVIARIEGSSNSFNFSQQNSSLLVRPTPGS